MNHIIGAKSAAATPAVKWLLVDEESAGQRLDNFLMRHLKGVPKTHVYRIIRSGEVRINKGRASAETRVENGDEVRLPPVRISARCWGRFSFWSTRLRGRYDVKTILLVYNPCSRNHG